MMDQESAYFNHLQSRKNSGLLRTLTDCDHPAPGKISVKDKIYVNFSSNDYLGLAHHPELIKRAQEFSQNYGAGSASSRLVTGNLSLFTQIEQKIARLKQKPAALIMASGFQTNAAVLQALFDKRVLGAEPLVFADKLNHASMHFGCAAANIRQIRYSHLDMNHLEQLLKKHASEKAPRFILTESVFSMDGDIAPIDEICTLAKAYNCLVICDDAHATGILGEKGAGLSGQADIVIGTFSKALGSFGAFVACSETIRDYLINTCTGLIYSTALPPAVLGAMDAALDLLPTLDHERASVAHLAQKFRDEVQKCGFDTAQSQTQIVPVIIGDERDTLLLSDKLKDHGFWVTAIRSPTVAKGAARLRFSFTPGHCAEDIEGVLKVMTSSKNVMPPHTS